MLSPGQAKSQILAKNSATLQVQRDLKGEQSSCNSKQGKETRSRGIRMKGALSLSAEGDICEPARCFIHHPSPNPLLL